MNPILNSSLLVRWKSQETIRRTDIHWGSIKLTHTSKHRICWNGEKKNQFVDILAHNFFCLFGRFYFIFFSHSTWSTQLVDFKWSLNIHCIRSVSWSLDRWRPSSLSRRVSRSITDHQTTLRQKFYNNCIEKAFLYFPIFLRCEFCVPS